MYKKTIDVPMIIGGNEVTTQKDNIYPPHDINHCVGHYYLGNESIFEEAMGGSIAGKSKMVSCEMARQS